MKYVIMNWYPYFYGNKKYAPSYKLTEINFNPCFAVNCKKDVRFKDRRMLNTTDFLMLDGICFHLSYVLNDAQVEGKLHTWGHSHQVDIKTWLSTKWYGWTPNTTNINPIGLINWPKAVEYKGEIPKELIGFSAGEQKYIKPEFKDWLNSKKKEWPAYFIVIMKDAKYLLRKMLKK